MGTTLRGSSAAVDQSRINFRHLVADVAWYGVAFPSVSRFLSIYAIRLGADAALLGWLAALPAIIGLFSSSLASPWRAHFDGIVKAIWIPGNLYRLMFLLPAATPFLPDDWQPYWLLLVLSLAAVPQGISSSLFLVVLRQSVTNQQLPALMSRRSLGFNVAVGLSTILLGFWLQRAPFPSSYQIMFIFSYIASIFSVLHVNRIQPLKESVHTEAVGPTLDLIKTPAFRQIASVTLIVYITYYSILPVIPLLLIDDLGAEEGFVSLFGLIELAGAALVSLRSDVVVRRFGCRNATAIGMAGTGIAALVLAFAPSLPVTLISAGIGGASWTLAALGLFNFFAENTPQEHITRFSTFYNQLVSLGMFIGPVLGSQLTGLGMNLAAVMATGGALRLAASLLIPAKTVKWPRRPRGGHAKPLT